MSFDTIAAAQNLKRRFKAQRQQRLALHARAAKESERFRVVFGRAMSGA